MHVFLDKGGVISTSEGLSHVAFLGVLKSGASSMARHVFHLMSCLSSPDQGLIILFILVLGAILGSA